MMPGTVVQSIVEQVTALPLVERRRAGEVFPRVPVGELELTREQVAAALFLVGDRLPFGSDGAVLVAGVRLAVALHGVSGLDAVLPELSALPDRNRAAQDAWSRAYWLCLHHWYVGAKSVELSHGQIGAALYASGLARTRRAELLHRGVDLDGYLTQGVTRIGAEAVVRLGDSLTQEFAALHPTAPDASTVAAMPDPRRRRFSFETAHSLHWLMDVPLLVRLDSGAYAVGTVPPANPFDIVPEFTARRAALRAGGAA